ncbi:MAG: SRPBCC family protein [Acidimicrobiales bacterium]
MDVTEALDAPCSPEDLFRWVDDLRLYPSWLDIVSRAESVAAAEGDVGPAWLVDLRGRLGPLARSKRLRMVRTRSEAPLSVRFERVELDDRDHPPWVLEGTIEPTEEGSRLIMHLHYGGSLLGSVVERLLRDEIKRSRSRLLALIASD